MGYRVVMAGHDPDALTLSAAFVRRNEAEPEWLARLPELVDELAARWGVTLGRPFPNVQINYVVPAQRADGTACVFKVSRHVGETRNEIAALRLWDGQGAARLLAADEQAGALLLERLEPGTMLVEIADQDDVVATRIAAVVLRQLWRQPPPDLGGLRTLASWCDAYDRNREALSRGERGFPAALFRRADALRQDLLDSTSDPVVLHGDMHHYNVLRAERAEWLAIDPKGLAGDRHFDVCQFLRTPWPQGGGLVVNRRRLDVFCAELGLNPIRARDWTFVHAMLDACWTFEDGDPFDEKVAYVEETLTL